MGRWMLRKIVLLLTALPLLMPPGTCVCRFDIVGPAGAASGVSTVRSGNCPTADRGCCGHRKAAAPRKAEAVDRQTASRLHVSGAGKGLPATPNKLHEPGCPALG